MIIKIKRKSLHKYVNDHIIECQNNSLVDKKRKYNNNKENFGSFVNVQKSQETEYIFDSQKNIIIKHEKDYDLRKNSNISIMNESII